MKALLPLLLAILLPACGKSQDPRPNLLIVTFDTTRSDHLACYGYGKPTSPHIDRLAADGVRYTNAYAVSSWTLPTHASIFTGKYPSSHGAHYDPNGKINLVMEGGIHGNPLWDAYRANTIATDQLTLAAILSESGYATKGIIGGPWLKEVFGLGKGFEDWDDSNFQMEGGSELNGRTAEDITDHAIAFVDAHADEPFFLFLNYYDPHSPYTVQPDYIRTFWSGPLPPPKDSWEWTLAKYDAEIRYTDEHFGRLLDHLRSAGLYDKTWIVLTSDHGELMGEMNMAGHGDSLSQPEIHIPLIVKEPGPTPRQGIDDTPVQQVDILPTVLDALGLPHPPDVQGRSLTRHEHPIVSEVYPLPFMNDASRKPWRQLGDWKSIVEGKWKFVWGSRGRNLLFDLEADPHEYRNVLADHPDIAASLEAKLESYFASLPAPGEAPEVEVGREDLEALKGVGYLGGDDE
ncbi:MAG TPA: hypothetical protein ENJ09_09205 [Planctomycetes bacterium]|nr:hypothetical protein [Planctomycetota bacterium]